MAGGGFEGREPGLQRDVEERVGRHAQQLVVRLHEEVGELGPARGVIHVAGVDGVGREGEEDAGVGVFVGKGVFERVEVFAGEEYSLEELVFFLSTDELDVLLEAELEFEVALA